MEFKTCIHHCVCIESDNCNPANCCEYKPENLYINVVFSVGDVVYIVVDNEITESVISMVSYSEQGGRCTFAYVAESPIGKYMFSKDDIDVTVFKDRKSAQNHIDTDIVQNKTVENSVENVETVSNAIVNKRVNTLSIAFNMMKHFGKPYLPLKYLRQSQSRLFNQIMIDSNLAGYDFTLLISDEDIINLLKQYSDILVYDAEYDIIALKPEYSLDMFILKYPIDTYVMNIICEN